MKTTKKRLLLLSIALLLLAGCSHHYIPRTTTFDFEEIDAFVSNSTISLINDQPFSEEVLFLSRGTHDYYADFKAWTEKAIVIAQREITSRGMKVVNDAPRFLKLSVMTAEGTTECSRSIAKRRSEWKQETDTSTNMLPKQGRRPPCSVPWTVLSCVSSRQC